MMRIQNRQLKTTLNVQLCIDMNIQISKSHTHRASSAMDCPIGTAAAAPPAAPTADPQQAAMLLGTRASTAVAVTQPLLRAGRFSSFGNRR